MARFALGQPVWAGRDITIDSSGDCNARWGDKLYVLKFHESSMNYLVGHTHDVKYGFWCHSDELMGQEPLPGNNPYLKRHLWGGQLSR